MSDYDFTKLNDKEFEEICADIIGESVGCKVERFKPGKDKGVDGRFFSPNGGEVIVQCKHRPKSTYTQLISHLKSEKAKVDALAPEKYILALSNELSRANKAEIKRIFHPHLKSDSDIYGREDLNDILKRCPSIEKKHYKLWLSSSSVIEFMLNNDISGRSDFFFGDIKEKSSLYVKIDCFDIALKKLNAKRILIITGEPGVGKTTLANHLALHYAAQGYEFCQIIDEIRDGERAFQTTKKQLFYFDDFLGRNYLEALKGNETSHIVTFMKRVAHTKDKLFILTSRSTILSHAKYLSDIFEIENTKKNEYELKINELSLIEKARILYNHIWHSALELSFIEEIYKEKRYVKIVNHKNFNPRLISFITDKYKLEEIESCNYWSYISKSLSNPKDIWKYAFDVQIDTACQAIVMLATVNMGPIAENELQKAYDRILKSNLLGIPAGSISFREKMTRLTGSFLKRTINDHERVMVDLINPSLGDYTIEYISSSLPLMKSLFYSIQTTGSIKNLRSLVANKKINQEDLGKILESVLDEIQKERNANPSYEYIAQIYQLIASSKIKNETINKLILKIYNTYFSQKTAIDTTSSKLELLIWLRTNNDISQEHAAQILRDSVEEIESENEIKLFQELSSLSMSTTERESFKDKISKKVIELIIKSPEDYIPIDECLSQVGESDYKRAERNAIEILTNFLDKLEIQYSDNDIESMVDACDIYTWVDNHYENWRSEEDDFYNRTQSTEADIYDLFERN